MLHLFLTALAVVVTYLLYRYSKFKTYWKDRGVKYLEPLPLIGNSLPLISKKVAVSDFINNLHKSFPNERYFGMFQFQEPVLVLNDLDLIKQVTIKSFESFSDHKTVFSPNVDPLWGKNLFSSTGDRWFSLRRTLSPAFTSSKMKAMYVLIDECATDLVSYFKEQKQDVLEFEVKDIFSRFTSDVIATTAFGIHLQTCRDKDNEFYNFGKRIADFTGFKGLKFLMYGIPDFILKALNIKLINDDTGNFFRKIIRDTIHSREKNNIIRPDLIHLLMEAKKGRMHVDELINNERKTKKVQPIDLDEEDMTAQALVFFLGGFDTTSGLLSLLMYELCANPDVQEKLREEIDETRKITGEKVSYDALMKMKYMDMVVTETMRKWPQATIMDRVVGKPFTIEPVNPGEKPLHLDVGTVCWIPVHGIHRNPKYYEDPEKFDPERFSDENKHKINFDAYMPFGAGPRICIGSRYALMVNKLVLFYILENFKIVRTAKTKIPIVVDKNNLVLSAEGGFYCGFQKR